MDRKQEGHSAMKNTFSDIDSLPARMMLFIVFLLLASVGYVTCVAPARADGRECDDVADYNDRHYCIGVTTNDPTWCDGIKKDGVLKRLCKTYASR